MNPYVNIHKNLDKYLKSIFLENIIVVLSGTPTRIPDRRGFPFWPTLTDLGGISIFKMTHIFGYGENLVFASNQSIWTIFTWKWHGKVSIMLLTSFETIHMHIYETDFGKKRFSRSPLQYWPYSKIRYFTFFGKYLVCGLIFEISAIS